MLRRKKRQLVHAALLAKLRKVWRTAGEEVDGMLALRKGGREDF